jgi:hypothetical protein
MKSLPPAKTMKIKNHISTRGKTLNNQLVNKFGVSLHEFEKACLGDITSIQRIGELSRQARFMKEYAPRLKEAYIQIIEGSTTYNLALADILKAAGSASLQIDKAAASTTLADQKFVHGRIELAKQVLMDKKVENDRHQYQLNYSQIKGYMDAFLVDVDRQSAILEQSNRPEVKQVQEDKAYESKVIDEYLEEGDKARPDLIPNRNYRGIKGKFEQIKAALGF